jgi:hypothetical protein
METIRSPKRRFELELHGAKSQKASIIDTAVFGNAGIALWSG